ncbi:hypothetical protein QF031_000033 [Pseudarthrobacter defluvii]|nr:hypothetical protein [Pseudarthrobacter defluvii]
MTIRVHIESLILEGLPSGALDTAQLGSAVQAELGRLLGEAGLHPGLASRGTFRSVQGAPLRAPAGRAGPLGVQIASAIHGALTVPGDPA